jgi:hypothetical protein
MKTVPKKIPGSWDERYALDRHTLSNELLAHDEFGSTTQYPVGVDCTVAHLTLLKASPDSLSAEDQLGKAGGLQDSLDP